MSKLHGYDERDNRVTDGTGEAGGERAQAEEELYDCANVVYLLQGSTREAPVDSVGLFDVHHGQLREYDISEHHSIQRSD